jgi:hypothetical protein
MNQAQFVAERGLRGDAGWSPLVTPFAGFAAEIERIRAAFAVVGDRECQVLASLPEDGTPVLSGVVWQRSGIVSRNQVYDALRELLRRGMVARVGLRGKTSYRRVAVEGEPQ